MWAVLHQDFEPWMGDPLGAVVILVATVVSLLLLAPVHLLGAVHAALDGTRRRPTPPPDRSDRRVLGHPLLDGAQPFLQPVIRYRSQLPRVGAGCR